MSDSEFLPFDNETLDDGRTIVVSYGSKWARYLVHAAAMLTNPGIWEPSSDVELAVFRANELIARLIGESAVDVQQIHTDPIYVCPMGMHAASDEPVNLAITSAGAYFHNRVYCGGSANYKEWIYFDVWLPAGEYDFRLFIPKAPNRGKISLSSDPDVGLGSTIYDLYDASTVITNYLTIPIEVVEDALVRFTIKKEHKNPLSTNGYTACHAVLIWRTG